MGCELGKLCSVNKDKAPKEAVVVHDDDDADNWIKPTSINSSNQELVYIEQPPRIKYNRDYTKEVNRYYSQKVQLSRDEADRNENIAEDMIKKILKYIHNNNPVFEEEMMKVGSSWQKLKISRHDFDVNVKVNLSGKIFWKNIRVEQNYDFNPNNIEKLVYSDGIMEDIKPGYFVLKYRPKAISYDDDADDFCFDGDLIPKFVKREFKKLVKKALKNVYPEVDCKPKNNGPAIKVRVQPEPGQHEISIDLDLTPNVHSTKPLGKWVRWPRSDANWPSQDKIDQIKEISAHFVPKEDLLWRVSFALCEAELIKDIDKDGGCRKKLHRVMKQLTKDAWGKERSPTKIIPSSYVLKNILFWECEEYCFTEDWSCDKVWTRLESMTERLKEALEQRHLKQYFYPKVNLLKENLDEEKILRVIDRIDQFLDDPVTYLTVNEE